MIIPDEIRKNLASLSPHNVSYLEHVLAHRDGCDELDFEKLPEIVNPNHHYLIKPWPTFISAEKNAQLERTLRGVTHLIRLIPERVFQYDFAALAQFYNLPEAMISQITPMPNRAEATFSRLDFMETDGKFKCLEANYSAMLGVFMANYAGDTILEHPVNASFIAQHQLKPRFDLPLEVAIPFMIDDMLANGFGQEGDLNLGLFLDRGEMDIISEMSVVKTMEVYDRHLRQRGISGASYRVFVDEFKVKKKGLFKKSGFLKRDVRLHGVMELTVYARPPLPALQTFLDRDVLFYNGPINRMLTDKRNLALLSRHRDSGAFSKEEQAMIDEYIPWSRLLTRGEVTFQGEKVHLPDFLFSHKDQLVLKPGVGSMGVDVALGAFTTEDQWRKMVEKGLEDGGFLVQERLEPPRYIYPFIGKALEHDVVWGSFIFGDRYGGTVLRMLPTGKGGGIINSTQGAPQGVLFNL